jgi:hypothetical protein
VIPAALLLLCAPVPAEQPVSKVAFSESRDVVRAFSPYGETTLPVIRVQLEIHRTERNERGELLVVYDPHSGHYLWRYVRANHAGDTTSWLTEFKSGRAAVYTAPGSIYLIHMPANLGMQGFEGTAPTLDAAESASIAEIQRSLPEFPNNGYTIGMRAVAVARTIGKEFACSPEWSETSGDCGFGIKSFVSVTQEGDNWRLVLRNRWDQEVILDSKFNLISTRRLPDPEKQ